MLSKHTFKIWRKMESDFFSYHRGTLSKPYKVGYQKSQRAHQRSTGWQTKARNVMLIINLRISPSLHSTTKKLCLFFFILKPFGNTIIVLRRWYSCGRWFNSLLMIKSLLSLRKLVSLASLVKTWGAFNSQNCDRTGRVVCQCNASVQLKWENCWWPLTRAGTVWPVR